MSCLVVRIQSLDPELALGPTATVRAHIATSFVRSHGASVLSVSRSALQMSPWLCPWHEGTCVDAFPVLVKFTLFVFAVLLLAGAANVSENRSVTPSVLRASDLKIRDYCSVLQVSTCKVVAVFPATLRRWMVLAMAQTCVF